MVARSYKWGMTGPEPSAADEALVVEAADDLLNGPEAGSAALRGGVLRVIGFGANAIMGAAAAAVLFRHLGVRDTGLYVTAVSVVAVVGGLSDLGITAQGVRELSVRDAAGRRSIMRNLLGLRTALTAVGVVASLAFAVAVGYRSVVVAGVGLAGIGLIVQNLQGTLSLSLMSRLRLGAVTAIDSARQAFVTLGTVVLVLVLVGAGLVPFVALAIPAAGATLVATVILVRGDVPWLPHFDLTEWRVLVRDLLPYVAAVALSFIYLRLSVIAVSLTATPPQLGYFGISFRILEVLIVIPGLMVTAVFPIFARSALDDRERLTYAVSRVFVVMLIAGAWMSLIVAVLAPVAIEVVGGPPFEEAVGVLRVQAVGLGFSFLAVLWGSVLLSLRRLRELMYINLTAFAAGMVLVSILHDARRPGRCSATVITECALAAGAPLALLRRDRHLLPSPWPLVPVFVATAAGAAVAFGSGFPALAGAAAATAVYFGLLLLFRVVPEEVLVELRGAVAGRRRRHR